MQPLRSHPPYRLQGTRPQSAASLLDVVDNPPAHPRTTGLLKIFQAPGDRPPTPSRPGHRRMQRSDLSSVRDAPCSTTCYLRISFNTLWVRIHYKVGKFRATPLANPTNQLIHRYVAQNPKKVIGYSSASSITSLYYRVAHHSCTRY